MISPFNHKRIESDLSLDKSPTKMLEASIEIDSKGNGTDRKNEKKNEADSRLESEIMSEDGARPIGIFSGRVTIN